MEVNGAYDLRTDGLVGKRMYLDEASVMGTENAIMAAVLAEGETIVGHAACEPHIQDLCRFLVSLGAQIEGIGSNVLHIQGVDRLGGGSYRIGPEHIEVASFAALAAVTGGDLTIEDVEPDDLFSIVPAFRKLGIELEVGESTVRVPPGQRLEVVDDLGGQIPKIESGIWPAFPADLTSIAVVAATQATGTVLVFEKMFESRLFFVDKLVSMGARIILCDPHRAVVTGPARLVRAAPREPGHPGRHGDGDRRALRRRPLHDREHPLGRPRLRAHRRAPPRPRRRHRARRAVSGARLARGSGESNIATGVPLLDHLLVELALRGRLRALARDRAGRACRRGRRGRRRPRPRARPAPASARARDRDDGLGRGARRRSIVEASGKPLARLERRPPRRRRARNRPRLALPHLARRRSRC